MNKVALETEEQYQELTYGMENWDNELWKVIANLLSEDVQVYLHNRLSELKKEKTHAAYSFAPKEEQRKMVEVFFDNTEENMLAFAAAFGNKYVLTHLVRFNENDWYLYMNYNGDIYTIPKIKNNYEYCVFNLYRWYMKEPSLAKIKALQCPTLMTYIEEKYNQYLKEKAKKLEEKMQFVLQVEVKDKIYLKICKNNIDAWITLKNILKEVGVEEPCLSDCWGKGLNDMATGKSSFTMQTNQMKVTYFTCLAP